VGIFSTGAKLNKRGFTVATIPYFPFFGWYYIFSNDVLKFIVEGTTQTFFLYNASFNFLVFLTLILSSSIIRKIDKTSLIYAWSILSSIGTIFLALASTSIFKLAIYFLLGVVFAIGVLSYFVSFWDMTVPEERGRVAGLIGFLFLPIFLLIVSLASNLDFFTTGILCLTLNLGTLAIKPLDPSKITKLTAKKDSKGYRPEKRTVLLYLIPWAVFSFINATLAKTVSFHASQYFLPSSLMLLGTLEVIGGGLGAMIGGVIADFFGRRLSLALGLTLYGISSAISGLTKSYEMLQLAFIASGLTWGILLTLYLFVIWGDLADLDTCPLRYSIGLGTFYLAAGVGVIFSPELLQIPFFAASITSCLLIFLSNLPLILAPELLPLDFREKIRLKSYINLVKKKAKYLSSQG